MRLQEEAIVGAAERRRVFRRILLKLSGESLMGDREYGMERATIDAVAEEIVEGMLNKRFFGANVLVDQEWVHDSSKTVGQALQEAGAEVLEFERLSVSG